MTKTNDKRLLNEQQIQEAVRKVADRLNQKYSNLSEQASKPVLAIALINGSLVFAADLIRELTFPIEFITAMLAGEDGNERLIVNKKDLNPKGREVLLIDDIFDTGNTLSCCVERLINAEVASIQCTTLLTRDERFLDNARQPLNVIEGYVIRGKDFVYGYGLDDSHGLNRNLREIYVES